MVIYLIVGDSAGWYWLNNQMTENGCQAFQHINFSLSWKELGCPVDMLNSVEGCENLILWKAGWTF